MVAIIVLNWNGYEDTCKCIASLNKMKYDEYFVAIGDNGSTNGSIQKIREFCQSNKLNLIDESMNTVHNRDILLFDLKVNNGFAKGNNLLVSKIAKFIPDYYLFLNNDTEVDSQFLSILVSFQNETKLKVLTPLILYYSNRDIVWNAGGKLIWGSRKYYYADKKVTTIKEKKYLLCTFVTGCALFVTPDIIDEGGRIFTERFFFGEEDFELSLRLKERKIKVACVMDSIIYHKVSSSTKKKTNNLRKNYIHYLNRYINMRNHMNRLEFWLWRRFNNQYIRFLLTRKGNSLAAVNNLIKNLNKNAFLLDGVTKDYFEEILGLKK